MLKVAGLVIVGFLAFWLCVLMLGTFAVTILFPTLKPVVWLNRLARENVAMRIALGRPTEDSEYGAFLTERIRFRPWALRDENLLLRGELRARDLASPIPNYRSIPPGRLERFSKWVTEDTDEAATFFGIIATVGVALKLFVL
jgi:hypothetical protein